MKKIKEFINSNYQWIILFVSLICFLLLAEDVFKQDIIKIDIIGQKIAALLFKFEISTSIAKFVTSFGGAFLLIIVAAVLFMVIKNKKIGISILSNLTIITGLNILLKNIVQRTRPFEYQIITETGYSFPSGHSMVSMAFYGYLIYLSYKYIKNKKVKYFVITVLGILVFLIGASRIYLRVHYTSDVLAGFLISISYLVIYIKSTNKYLIKRGGSI